ncbi:MAG TPA: competence/damage-inducible protein A [Gemmatimonadales bacterium]|nr:competence/damage-inducible protein A [Gemmatimonadales bacterium]
MDLELVTIGTELLLGFTIDTNAAEIARALAPAGARVVRRTTVGDDGPAIAAAVRDALGRTGLVIVTGGLGPTRDDVTKRAVAELFGAPLELDQAYLERLRERFARMGRAMPAINRTQAEVPRGAVVLSNRWGTAPGLWLEGGPGTVVMLPGVPKEMRGLLAAEVLPRLAARMTAGSGTPWVIASRTLRTTGIAESALAERIGALEDQLAPATLAYLPGVDGVDLRLTVWDLPQDRAAQTLAGRAELLRPALGSHFYGEESTDLAAVVLDLLRQRGFTLALAESCTGGLLGARLTAVPGSSDVFVGAVIAYADGVKTAQLEVPADVLEAQGAVSQPAVEAMARGAQRTFHSGAVIAVTGIAGPGGGTAEKPVGTVWIAAALNDRLASVQRRFPGDRDDVRRRSAQAGLDLLRMLLTASDEK